MMPFKVKVCTEFSFTSFSFLEILSLRLSPTFSFKSSAQDLDINTALSPRS